MKPVKSPHNRGYVMTGARLISGRKMATSVHCWMEANEASFWQIHGFLRRMQSEGYKGRVRDRVAAFCIDQKISVGEAPYAFNNSWWAGVSRYLVLHNPSFLGNPISFRDSDIDCFGLLPVSYLPRIGEE